MPALAYNTFELYDGLAEKGGIINYRLYYGMLQTIAKREEFPEGTGDKMRGYMLNRMVEMNKMVSDAEEEIPKNYWIDVSQFVKDDIDHFSKRVRTELSEENVNSQVALKLFWKIRCRMDPSRGECKSDFPEVTQRPQLAQSAPKKAATPVRKETQSKQSESQQTANLLEQQKQLEDEITRQQQEIEALALINAEIKQDNARLSEENKELQVFTTLLEQEKLALQNSLQELKEKYKHLVDDAGTDEQKPQVVEQNKTPDVSSTEEDEAALTLENAEANTEQEEDKGGVWHFLFGWI